MVVRITQKDSTVTIEQRKCCTGIQVRIDRHPAYPRQIQNRGNSTPDRARTVDQRITHIDKVFPARGVPTYAADGKIARLDAAAVIFVEGACEGVLPG